MGGGNEFLDTTGGFLSGNGGAASKKLNSAKGKSPSIMQPGSVPPEFQRFLEQAFSKIQGGAPSSLGGGVGAAFNQQLPDLITGALQTLQQGTSGEGFVPNVLQSVEARLRPLTELSKKTAGADVMESAASLGQTRSSGTVETLGRTFAGLEGQLQNTLGGIEASLAPIAAQQPLQSAQTAFGVLDQLRNAQAGESQFNRGLGAQLFANTPYQAPIVDPGKGKGGGGGGIASAAASMFCWAAAEVFDGWADPRTVAARRYIAQRAPRELRDKYARHGRALAAEIRRDPALRAEMTAVMSQFATLGSESYVLAV